MLSVVHENYGACIFPASLLLIINYKVEADPNSSVFLGLCSDWCSDRVKWLPQISCTQRAMIDFLPDLLPAVKYLIFFECSHLFSGAIKSFCISAFSITFCFDHGAGHLYSETHCCYLFPGQICSHLELQDKVKSCFCLLLSPAFLYFVLSRRQHNLI